MLVVLFYAGVQSYYLALKEEIVEGDDVKA
jgi:hypothetical protein